MVFRPAPCSFPKAGATVGKLSRHAGLRRAAAGPSQAGAADACRRRRRSRPGRRAGSARLIERRRPPAARQRASPRHRGGRERNRVRIVRTSSRQQAGVRAIARPATPGAARRGLCRLPGLVRVGGVAVCDMSDLRHWLNLQEWSGFVSIRLSGRDTPASAQRRPPCCGTRPSDSAVQRCQPGCFIRSRVQARSLPRQCPSPAPRDRVTNPG